MIPDPFSEWLHETCEGNPVIPILTIEDPNNALPLLEAITAAGIKIVEITLRTKDALKVIKKVSDYPGCLIGAGTILTPDDAKNALRAGADFGVSPGTTPELAVECYDLRFPMLPGVVTPSEIMQLYNIGYMFMKFFPAESSGGCTTLKSIAGPLPEIQFCPTGGITESNASKYLELDNVHCVGGSWIATPEAIRKQDWDGIEKNARRAQELLTVQK